jgi:hypothetical protein
VNRGLSGRGVRRGTKLVDSIAGLVFQGLRRGLASCSVRSIALVVELHCVYRVITSFPQISQVTDAACRIGQTAWFADFVAVVAWHLTATFDLQRATLQTGGMAALPALGSVVVCVQGRRSAFVGPEMTGQKVPPIEDHTAVLTDVLLRLSVIVGMPGQGRPTCICSTTCAAGKHVYGRRDLCEGHQREEAPAMQASGPPLFIRARASRVSTLPPLTTLVLLSLSYQGCLYRSNFQRRDNKRREW